MRRIESIRHKLSQGLLPSDLPDRIWGGPASGKSRCAACDEVIATRSLEIEANCVDGKNRCYHSACHSVLSLEREGLSEAGGLAPAA